MTGPKRFDQDLYWPLDVAATLTVAAALCWLGYRLWDQS